MNDLLAFSISAHGGLERWNSFRTLEARMSVGGGIFAAKQNPDLQDKVTYKVFTHEERLIIDHFSAPDRRISFVPSRLTLETIGGDIVDLAFGILFGGIVLALALAVGLGSRELVSRSLEREASRPVEVPVEEKKLHHF